MANIPSSNVLCRYFLENTCRAGAKCKFMHDVTLGVLDEECRFYRVDGKCRYGRRCNYDHVRRLRDGSIEIVSQGRMSLGRDIALLSDEAQKLESPEPEPTSSARLPLCKEFESSGVCSSPDCSAVHGGLCKTCGKHIIHPHNRYLNLVHESQCKPHRAIVPTLGEMLLRQSADLMCGICLETVYMKLGKGSKRFGLLSECRHVFCWDCIRIWRTKGNYRGIDVIKTCPECTIVSEVVIPSVFYISGGEVKDHLFRHPDEKELDFETTHLQKDFNRLNFVDEQEDQEVRLTMGLNSEFVPPDY